MCASIDVSRFNSNNLSGLKGLVLRTSAFIGNDMRTLINMSLSPEENSPIFLFRDNIIGVKDLVLSNTGVKQSWNFTNILM
jgi:hypothetical protein